MGLACNVYTKLLFRLGHGHPLWEPEPTEAGEVLLGDVGYILDGGFYRLFNATLPDDHDIHKQSGVPEGYQPFTFPDTLLRRRPNALEAGPVCSKTVVAVQAEGSLSVGPASTGACGTLRFKCAEEQGAVLVLKHDARREAFHPSKDLTQYILRHHDAWFRFAQETFRLDIQQHDIIFVSGSVKTAEWALAAATHHARDCEIVFGGEFGPSAKAAFSFRATQDQSLSIEHRCGPKPCPDEPLTQEMPPKYDQCVFLHYYKLKRRRLLAPKVIRAAAGQSSLSRSPSPSESAGALGTSSCDIMDSSLDSAQHCALEMVPDREDVYDPVNDLLDFILDTTDATIAIASDEDVKILQANRTTNNDAALDDIRSFLSAHKSGIAVHTSQGVGMLLKDHVYRGEQDGESPLTPSYYRPSSLPSHPSRMAHMTRARSRSRSRPRSLQRLLSPTRSPRPIPSSSNLSLDIIPESRSILPKRARGRPPGSKNKKLAAEAAAVEAKFELDRRSSPRGSNTEAFEGECEEQDEFKEEDGYKYDDRPKVSPLPIPSSSNQSLDMIPESSTILPKRKRGRPQGSKHKTLAAQAAAAVAEYESRTKARGSSPRGSNTGSKRKMDKSRNSVIPKHECDEEDDDGEDEDEYNERPNKKRKHQ